MADFRPVTDFERFLDIHGSAAPFHPEFYHHFRSGDLLVLGSREELESGGFGISLELENDNHKPTVFIFTSLSALKASMELKKSTSAKYAKVPGDDMLFMVGQKAHVLINRGLKNQASVESLRG